MSLWIDAKDSRKAWRRKMEKVEAQLECDGCAWKLKVDGVLRAVLWHTAATPSGVFDAIVWADACLQAWGFKPPSPTATPI